MREISEVDEALFWSAHTSPRQWQFIDRLLDIRQKIDAGGIPSKTLGDTMNADTTPRAMMEKALREASGNPTSGAVADIIPTMVDALLAAIDGPKASQRVVKATETR